MGVQVKEPLASRNITLRSLRRAITRSGSPSRCGRRHGRLTRRSSPRCW